MTRRALIAGLALGTGLLMSVGVTEAADKQALRFAAKEIDCGSMMSPAGEYAAALSEAASFPAERQLVVQGMVVGKDGKPVQGLTVYFFPLDEQGPQCVLGMADGSFGFANPGAATDATGRFTITTGPLWEFTDEAVAGLLVRRSPDRPFDVGVLAVEDGQGMARLSLGAKQRTLDLGSMTLANPRSTP